MRKLSKRTIASRANGARSQGPTSDAGRRRSSTNSLRHGLLAKAVVLKIESTSVFGQFFDEHLQKLNPVDGPEYAIVEEIVAAAWRLRRLWAIESTLYNQAVDRSTSNTLPGQAADAFTALGSSNQLQLLDRYESRLQRMCQRALKTLDQFRKLPKVQPHPEPNEPILKPSEVNARGEHPVAESAPQMQVLPNDPKPVPTPGNKSHLTDNIQPENHPAKRRRKSKPFRGHRRAIDKLRGVRAASRLPRMVSTLEADDSSPSPRK
jgi:hypothetical protein